jgi:hypothetical protein
MLKIGRMFTISLGALTLSTMLETQTQAALSIKNIGTTAAVCAVTTGVSPNQCVAYFSSTTCHRSGTAPAAPTGCGGSFSGASSTCDDLVSGTFRCPQASLDLERDELYATTPDPSEMDMFSAAPTFTFAATPRPEQTATFVSMAASEPIIVAAKEPSPPPLRFVAYLADASGAGAGNLDLNPAVAVATFRPTTAAVRCMNNGGGVGGLGVPFSINVSITQNDIFDASNLEGRGQWGSHIPFPIEQLNEAIAIPTNACKQQWQIIPDSLTILSAIVDVVANACTDDNCLGVLIPTDRWATNCTYLSDGTNTCTTIFHCQDLDGPEREACLGQTLP